MIRKFVATLLVTAALVVGIAGSSSAQTILKPTFRERFKYSHTPWVVVEKTVKVCIDIIDPDFCDYEERWYVQAKVTITNKTDRKRSPDCQWWLVMDAGSKYGIDGWWAGEWWGWTIKPHTSLTKVISIEGPDDMTDGVTDGFHIETQCNR
jgi:hypothetical protein